MAAAKKDFRIIFSKIILFSYIILFPFGQVLRIPIYWPVQFTLQSIDIPVLLSLPLILFFQIKKPEVSGLFKDLLLFVGFSLLLSTFTLKSFYPVSYFYFIRIVSYFTFFIMVWNLITHEVKKGHPYFFTRIIDLLLINVLIISVFGWWQYLYLPDLTSLKYWGWDDHLYRLTSTLLDPGFTGIIIVLGILTAAYQISVMKKVHYIFLIIFFTLSLAFTYSRASYLAFIAGIFGFVFFSQHFKKIKKVLLILVSIFIISLPFLPKPAGEGVNLQRSFSIISRLNQYRDTTDIFLYSPVFGVGYNSLCLAKNTIVQYTDSASHSCSGSDSSILLILATTGIIGFMLFIYTLIEFVKKLGNNPYGILLKSSFLAILVHSQFTNSFFYSWVIGWMAIIAAGALIIKKNIGP